MPLDRVYMLGLRYQLSAASLLACTGRGVRAALRVCSRSASGNRRDNGTNRNYLATRIRRRAVPLCLVVGNLGPWVAQLRGRQQR